MLPANRVLGDDGEYVSAREICKSTGVELELLQRLQRAIGLPRIEDPDAAVLLRADAEAAARAKFFLDVGIDPQDAVAVMRVLMEGLSHAAAMMREAALKSLLRPGATEIELAQATEEMARRALPMMAPMMDDLLRLELRHSVETEAVNAAERAAGKLPGGRQVTVCFADLAGFTRLGEAIPPEDLERVASRLAELAHDVAASPVRFVKSIGDAVMLVSFDPVPLLEAVLDLVDDAAANDLPRLRIGVASGCAVSRAGDWFGRPVNVASRVTAAARPGAVLVAESARDAVANAVGFDWSSAGARRLKGVKDEVKLFRVHPGETPVVLDTEITCVTLVSVVAADRSCRWAAIVFEHAFERGADRDGIIAGLDALDAAFDKLAAADVDTLTHPELLAVLDHLETHRRRQPAVEHRLIARLAAEACPSELGGKNLAEVLSARLRIRGTEARRRIADAEDLAPRRAMTGEQLQPGLAATAAGQASGQIGPEHIRIIRTFFEQLPGWVDTQTREQAETTLASIAAGFGPDELRQAANRLMTLLDQDGEAPTDAERARRRHLILGKTGRRRDE